MKPNANKTTKSAQINRRVAAKKKKTVILCAVAAALAVAIIVAIVATAGMRKIDSPRTTGYKIEALTSGNVATTVSSSGSLNPITKETLTASELLAELEAPSIEFDEKLWHAVVDRVTVYNDERLVFSLKDGTEITVEL